MGRVTSHGVTVHYPAGWFGTAGALTNVTWPVQVIAVGSYRFSQGRPDGCSPAAVVAGVPRGQVFIFGWEYAQPFQYPQDVRGEKFDARPRHFKLGGFSNYECNGPSYRINFRERSRYFQVHVAFGRGATAAAHAAALRVLDSIRVSA